MNTQYYSVSIIWVIFAILVYRNAKERNLKSAIAWGILTFVFGIFGVIGYYFMVLRPNKKDS